MALLRVDPLLVNSPNVGTADGTNVGIGLYLTTARCGLASCGLFQARSYGYKTCPLPTLALAYLEFAGVVQSRGARGSMANTIGKTVPGFGLDKRFEVCEGTQRITADRAEVGQWVAADAGSPKGAARFFL